ncbi:MAG: diacylglycerol kinase [Desulfovibrionaceae bacterium]|nr:diacylglycerol kinase [Desulfovibrionaceae bacterium]
MREPAGARKPWSARLGAATGHVGKALGYSLRGLRTGMRLSLAFRQELMVLAVLGAALALGGKSPGQWLLCAGGWLLVMAAELFNSALEETLDLITRDFSLAVQYAKDMASAAVFLLMLVNAALWISVFGRDALDLAGI